MGQQAPDSLCAALPQNAPTCSWLQRLPSVTGPGRLIDLDKPCAYRLGFILLGPEGRGFGTLFSAIYKRLPLNCGLTVRKKTLKGLIGVPTSKIKKKNWRFWEIQHVKRVKAEDCWSHWTNEIRELNMESWKRKDLEFVIRYRDWTDWEKQRCQRGRDKQLLMKHSMCGNPIIPDIPYLWLFIYGTRWVLCPPRIFYWRPISIQPI